MPFNPKPVVRIAVIGGGPAGLMAAELLSSVASADVAIDLYDAMPSAGRKFLLAGKGGLNLTHAEPTEAFLRRFGEPEQPLLQAALTNFSAGDLRLWAQSLGIATFTGSSGRVFPVDMKAAPLLRAWLHRLRAAGVRFHMRHRWLGWVQESGNADQPPGSALQFATPAGTVEFPADAVVLALGGGSWARLGSDGSWVSLLAALGVSVAPLQPSNCGFDVMARPDFAAAATGQMPCPQPGPKSGWTAHFARRFAGQPLKTIALAFTDSKGTIFQKKGECVATATGIEGSLVYAASRFLRDEISSQGSALVRLDLLPDHSLDAVLAQVRHPRGSRSLSSHLKSRLGLDGIKAGLLYELLDKSTLDDPQRLAAAIKALPLRLGAARPIDEAISSAGGVCFEGLTAGLQISPSSGGIGLATLGMPVFCAGEMLDWEAPTGGYLINACMATGRAAGLAVLSHFGLQANEYLREQLSKQ